MLGQSYLQIKKWEWKNEESKIEQLDEFDMKKSYFLALCMCLYIHSVSAFELNSDKTPQHLEKVTVTGFKDPELLTIARLKKGYAAFMKNRNLAPNSEFKIQLKSDTAVIISLISGSDEKILIVENDLLSLPSDLPDLPDSATLISNQRKGTVRWIPHIRSIGGSHNKVRLGDYRLQCEVLWAMEKETVSMFVRGAFAAVGGPCGSSKIQVMFPTNFKNIESVQIALEGGVVKIPFDGSAIRAPIYNYSLSDDALVIIQ